MLKLRAKFEAKCPRHPGYVPSRDGIAGIKGGCGTCAELLTIANLHAEYLKTLAGRQAIFAQMGGRVSCGISEREMLAALKAGAGEPRKAGR